jgi:hypothetical protein
MIHDGFDADRADATASPIRGTNLRFVKGKYCEFSDEVDVDGKQFAVIDKNAGWQKLEGGCPPEYLMQKRGEPRPERPHVPDADWPLKMNGSGEREHPFKWTTYLKLVDIETGELSTLSGNTTGFNIAVGELSDQVSFMREVRPNAIAVVELESAEMPNEYRTQRPKFRIVGWREREGGSATPAMLPAPEQKQLEHSTTEKQEATENPAPVEKPAEKVESPAPAKKKKNTTKRGATRIDTKLKPIDEPSLSEILDDEIGF